MCKHISIHMCTHRQNIFLEKEIETEIAMDINRDITGVDKERSSDIDIYEDVCLHQQTDRQTDR